MKNHELEVVSGQINNASGYLDVFGPVAEETEPALHLKRAFRRLSRVVHPDRYQKASDRDHAAATFANLVKHHEEALRAVNAGRYGSATVLATVTTRKGTHRIIDSLGQGDICSTFRTESQLKGVTTKGFCKVARNGADNDLLQAEASALKCLHGPDVDQQYAAFTPTLLDSFAYRESGGSLEATVTPLLEGFYNLEQIKRAFPSGLDPLHVAWVWRRLLVALGVSHDAGVIHGAVLPRHVMILPEQHGVMLVDWCYATQMADGEEYPPLNAIIASHKDWYPPEVLSKKPPSPATDISIAARTMVFLLGGDPLTGNLPRSVPKAFRAFFQGCLYEDQRLRPQNAWLLLQEFDELLESMGSPYYPRRFRQFTMPHSVA